MRCFIATAFQLCFKVYDLEGLEIHVGLKLNGTHKLLAYADDVDVLGDNMDAIKKNTETLIDASRRLVWKDT
jgi:hypothetical protein